MEEINLYERLMTFARRLAAEQWHGSGTYEPSPSDIADRAVAQAKADIGRALLEALRVGGNTDG